MNLFDILGPVMVGPSSSHTAGAVRIGYISEKLLQDHVRKAEILLHGSFATTGIGHGTDKALIAGLLGMHPDDIRIPASFDLAKKAGMEFTFSTVTLKDAHPNTAVIYLIGINGHVARVRGASVGGGNILITNIDGYEVELTGQYPALITIHRDRPGVITQVTNILSRYEVNIAFMRVSRQNRGETAMMIMELDDQPTEDVMEECRQVYEVDDAFSIPAIG